MTSQNKLDSLQYIRAFAAVRVLITHVLQRLDIRLLVICWPDNMG